MSGSTTSAIPRSGQRLRRHCVGGPRRHVSDERDLLDRVELDQAADAEDVGHVGRRQHRDVDAAVGLVPQEPFGHELAQGRAEGVAGDAELG